MYYMAHTVIYRIIIESLHHILYILHCILYFFYYLYINLVQGSLLIAPFAAPDKYLVLIKLCHITQCSIAPFATLAALDYLF